MEKNSGAIRQRSFNMMVFYCLILKLTTGCSTPGKTVGLSTGIGAGLGAAVGAIADPGADGEYRTRNVVIGTALGAVGGLITGSAISGAYKKDTSAQVSSSPLKDQAIPSKTPRLIPARYEAKWVDSQVIGTKFIQGHFEYQILEQAHWEDGQ